MRKELIDLPYIGLDVGSSGCKAAVIDETGRILALEHAEYSFITPEAGRVELDPSAVLDAVKNVLRRIAPHSQPVKALAVSSLGESMVLQDAEGHILTNGIVYLDERGQEIAGQIQQKIRPDALHQLTGVPLSPMYSLCRYLWLREHRPNIIQKTKKINLFGDYITYILCGERAIDPSSASRTMLLDVKNLCWSQEIADQFDIPIDQFPTITATGTQLGKIRPAIADELGLPRHIEIIMGCHDQAAANLGSGVYHAGDTMAGQGSTESINTIIESSQITSKLIEYGVGFEPYIEPGKYFTIVGQLAHGSSIKWFVHTVGTDFDGDAARPGESLYDRAERACAPNAGDLYFLPYLSRVNILDANDHALGGFIGLDVTVSKAQMYRALLEGISFETRKSFELLEDMGFSPQKIVASGGSSKSPLFMQMKADILNRPIHILGNPEAGAAGLGMVCAVACGDVDNYQEGMERFVRIAKTYEAGTADYRSRYRRFEIIRETVKTMYAQHNLIESE